MIKKKLFSLLFGAILISPIIGFSQDCNINQDYTTVCIGNDIVFPAGINSGSAMSTNPGNNYGCLGSTPNSKWFFFKVTTTGSLIIDQTNSNMVDVDGAIWGPFDDKEALISNCGNFEPPLECDYAGSPGFSFDINVEEGKFYVLLVANYSGQQTEITLADGGSQATTDCGPDIEINKSTSSNEVYSGNTVDWVIKAKNKGLAKAEAVTITDILPDGVTYVSHSLSNGTFTSGIWSLDNLYIDDTETLTITTTVDNTPNPPFTITNKITNASSNYIDARTGLSVTKNEIDAFDTIEASIIKVACTKAPTLGLGINTNHGITTLQRAGADNGNWPMVRKGAWTALESKTKGFVITRHLNPEDQIIQPQEGMITYDTDDKCLKIYNGSEWKCYSISACP